VITFCRRSQQGRIVWRKSCLIALITLSHRDYVRKLKLLSSRWAEHLLQYIPRISASPVGVPRGKKQAVGGGVKGVLSGTSIIRRSNLLTCPERKPRISLRNVKSRNYPITAVVLLTPAKFRPRPGYSIAKLGDAHSSLSYGQSKIFTAIRIISFHLGALIPTHPRGMTLCFVSDYYTSGTRVT
jgi:hypothetical protein